ncbi:hypothetical protein CHELA20_51616 [Hyphomicrobiales bacterium]|nr:hypothetical protein CHELA41_23396 [Hyphomicrobiales bacterium]CAH1677302.1 hypothetical protein CHELA20_51616 [Hyphomicrobiales bacterium]
MIEPQKDYLTAAPVIAATLPVNRWGLLAPFAASLRQNPCIRPTVESSPNSQSLPSLFGQRAANDASLSSHMTLRRT